LFLFLFTQKKNIVVIFKKKGKKETREI